ncbi:MAG: iron-sulfur cluster carrier protein ApbC [Gammaproteobacteria bacterium]|nr:MAG: iron-sulfur cluster carrier protein ApbC [Gammaproteobacteria bacterium]
MANIDKQQIEDKIKEYIDPFMQQDLIKSNCIKDIKINGFDVNVDIVLGYASTGFHDKLTQTITDKIKEITGIGKVKIDIKTDIIAHTVQKGIKRKDNIKNIIAVASGKGGVGKSTVSVNLAIALQKEGATVGLLDADIYGPSQPQMLGIDKQPDSKDGKLLEPLQNHGIQAMSIGFLVDSEQPMIWRGPMVTQALEQLLNDTNWQDLDYLIIDLPPGTGDTQLTLAQKVPLSGAVIVTTPQDIALLDARKGLKMFQKVEVPILGIVENMSYHICKKCGEEENIFGTGGGNKMADQYEVDFLGALPLDISIREDTDSGNPTVARDESSKISQIYRDIARRTSAKLALQAKDYSAKFPNIVISND